MTPEKIIQDVQEYASEWIEMSEDPAMFIARILANQIIKLEDYIKYLEVRLGDVCRKN